MHGKLHREIKTMKCVLILQAVLLWTTTRGDSNLQVDTDFPGSDIQTVLAPDAEYCQLICSNHPRCKFFTFIIKHPQIVSFTCFLKNTDNGIPLVRNPLPNAVSGFALPTTDLSTANCFRKTFKDIDFLGSDIKVVMTEDPTECQESCTKYKDCQFFTYVTENYKLAPELRKLCFLKFITKLPSPPVINILNGVVSGYSQRGCSDSDTCDGECTDVRIPDIDFPGNDIDQVLAPDAEHCQLICSTHPRCQHFTFLTEDWTQDNRRFFCFLKSTDTLMPSIKGLANVVSGFSLRSFCLRKKCINQVYKDLDFPGNDHQEVKVDSDIKCQTLCTEDPLCQFFTYVTQGFSNAALRQSCYLKNVLALPLPPKINDLKDVVSGFSLKECSEDPVTEILP